MLMLIVFAFVFNDLQSDFIYSVVGSNFCVIEALQLIIQ